MFGLTKAKDHLGKSRTQRAVVINLGEPEVLIGEVAKSFQYSVDALVAVAQRFQVSAEVDIIHIVDSQEEM
jgi:hypothetical protein